MGLALAVHSGRYHRQAVWPCRRVGCLWQLLLAETKAGNMGGCCRFRWLWRCCRTWPLGADSMTPVFRHCEKERCPASPRAEFGRAHACTPVPHSHLACRIHLDKHTHSYHIHLTFLII